MSSPVDSIHKIPGIRKSTMDFGVLSKKRHSVFGMLEIDVTHARENIKSLRKTEKISLFAWLVSAICQHMAENNHVGAIRKRGSKLYRFNAVKATVMVEKEQDGNRIPHVLLIDRAHEKSPAEITREINKAREKKLEKGESEINRQDNFIRRLYFYLPGFLRRAAIRFILRNPVRMFNMMGNVVITSVGMVGKVHGWFLQSTVHPLSIGIGSVLEKPWIVDGEIVPRQILNISINFDHDVIDGAEMARFIKTLVQRIEKG